MLTRRHLLVVPITLALALPVSASPVEAHPDDDGDAAAALAVAWQRIALRTIFTEGGTPPQTGTLYLAFASTAVHDAATAAERRGNASARAAVATAAHDVLSAYFPASGANLDADLDAALASVPDGHPETKGVRIGQKAAAKVVASREGDGRDDMSIVYQRDPGPGVWQPPTGGAMATAWLGFVDPLVRIRPVRVDGPDDVTSAAYAADYQEVASLGSTSSTARTTEQTNTSRFFAFNPPVMYRVAVCELLEGDPLDLAETTRLFATIDTAVATAMIETFRLKFDLGFWRPFEAISFTGDDGNPGTTPQAGWVPLIANPAYADYTSGHAAATAPFARVMRHTFGDDVTLHLTNPVLGAVDPSLRDRGYSSLSALEHDALNARIWGGLHFRDAMDDGYSLGHRTAHRVLRVMH